MYAFDRNEKKMLINYRNLEIFQIIISFINEGKNNKNNFFKTKMNL